MPAETLPATDREILPLPVSSAARQPIKVGERGILITSLDDLWRFAQYVSHSGLAPKEMKSPETILTAIQLGLELGLAPMSALQNIAVINGRPGIFGDAALALVRQSGLLDEFDEWFEVGGQRVERLPALLPDDAAAVCASRRRGQKRPEVTTFGVADARRAGLWGKNLYATYPQRMLRFRARGFNLRDNFGDILKGFKTVEELGDYDDIPAVRTLPPIALPAPSCGITAAQAEELNALLRQRIAAGDKDAIKRFKAAFSVDRMSQLPATSFDLARHSILTPHGEDTSHADPLAETQPAAPDEVQQHPPEDVQTHPAASADDVEADGHLTRLVDDIHTMMAEHDYRGLLALDKDMEAQRHTLGTARWKALLEEKMKLDKQMAAEKAMAGKRR